MPRLNIAVLPTNFVPMQRNLALELVRVTEAAALASGRWLGKGDKNAADQVSQRICQVQIARQAPCIHRSRHSPKQLEGVLLCMQAAVDMMRKVLNSIHMEGVVVIGEGEKDEVRQGSV